MKTTIFLPQKINIGYDERDDTYSGKLAYVICFDESGKLKKEKSWEKWRDKKLGNDIYENVPTSGFVLNKKVGGYKSYWNIRQTMIRVYDPRGFEFEITPANLLYILENCTSTKGKGLEGEFVYGWEGTELVLVPVDSPDYQELTKINELLHAQNFVKAKELKIGATYLSRDNVEHIYMGRFDEYEYGKKKDKQSFYFYKKEGDYFTILPSIAQKFVAVISDDCADNYSDLFEKLEYNVSYSPVDENAYEYVPYTLEDFIAGVSSRPWYFYCYNGHKTRFQVRQDYYSKGYYAGDAEKHDWYYGDHRPNPVTLEEIFNRITPMYRKAYLVNGKFYREEK